MSDPSGIESAEILHKVCGSLEVARDLVNRSGELFAAVVQGDDIPAVESIMHASAALDRAVEALAYRLSGRLPRPVAVGA